MKNKSIIIFAILLFIGCSNTNTLIKEELMVDDVPEVVEAPIEPVGPYSLPPLSSIIGKDAQ